MTEPMLKCSNCGWRGVKSVCLQSADGSKAYCPYCGKQVWPSFSVKRV